MVTLDKRLQWVNVKQKPFRQIQTHSSISRNYSGIFRTMCNPGIFRIVVYPEPDIFRTRSISRIPVYPEPWYIQNPSIFKTLAYRNQKHIHNPGTFRSLVYSEHWYIQNPRHIQKPAKYLRRGVLRKKLTEIGNYYENHYDL